MYGVKRLCGDGDDESVYSLEQESSLVADVPGKRSVCRWSPREPFKQKFSSFDHISDVALKSSSLDTGTQIVPPLPTLSASITTLPRLDRDPITMFQVGHAGTDGDDLSTRFVSQNERGFDRIVSNPSGFPEFHIRTADSGEVLDAYQARTRSDGRNVQVTHTKR